MAIIISKQKKKQKYLILVFVAVVVITTAVLWFGFLKPSKPVTTSSVSFTPREIKIDFEFLKGNVLKNLKPFEEILPLEQVGRENPFISY